MDETLPRFRRFLERLRRALPWLAAAAAIAVSAWTFSGGWHWTGEAAADYRWHLGWACFALGGAASLFRSWVPTLVLLALGAVHVGPELRLSVPRNTVVAAERPLTVALVTLSPAAPHQTTFLDWLAPVEGRPDPHPDVLFITQVDRDALGALDELEQRGWTSHALWPPLASWTADTRGRALVARVPLGDVSIREDGAIFAADVDVDGDVDSEPIQLVAAATPRPLSAETVAHRARIVDAVAALAARSPATVVLVQLNATGYSPAFRRLTAEGGLADSRLGFGRQTSWSSDRFLPGMELAVDHVLVGDGVAVVERKVPYLMLGFGHQPVVCRVAPR